MHTFKFCSAYINIKRLKLASSIYFAKPYSLAYVGTMSRYMVIIKNYLFMYICTKKIATFSYNFFLIHRWSNGY